jgi:hypothetical protein
MTDLKIETQELPVVEAEVAVIDLGVVTEETKIGPFTGWFEDDFTNFWP